MSESDRHRITYQHFTLTREHFANKQTLRGLIGTDVDAQVVVVDNVESLYWDEFKSLSNANEMDEMRKDCRVGKSEKS